MSIGNSEQVASKILIFGAPAISLLIISGSVTDPVNAPKLALLGGIAFSAGALSIRQLIENRFKDSVALLTPAVIFLLCSISAILNSTAPLSQNLYGVYGRNTGFFAYLFFILLFLSNANLTKLRSLRGIIYGLLFAGVINILYSLWAWQIGDFISWNNQYNRILGTFGNPNFIGSFLGITVSLIFAIMLDKNTSLLYRTIGAVLIIVAVLEIQYSKAVQGVVVSAGGIALVVFFYLRDKCKTWLFPLIYSLFVVLVGFFSISGALQIGPLSKFIYKTSVSLRGEYWQAAINMALKKPLVGVGMDSYGDWYRRARDGQALVLPGPNVVTNAAHNVPLDILAYGGWPLFCAYLSFIALTGISILRVIIRSKNYDWIFVSLSVAWICYQVQSLISINQIGLAIWGWILGGGIIAYDRISKSNPVPKKELDKYSHFSPQLIALISFIVGVFIAIPPFNADRTLTTALKTKNLNSITTALTPSYLTPPDSFRLVNITNTFEISDLPDFAHRYALEGVKFNPNYFDAWRILYSLKSATSDEKQLAKTNMIRLDPLNDEWKQLP